MTSVPNNGYTATGKDVLISTNARMLCCLSIVIAAVDPTPSACQSLVVSNSCFKIKPFNKKIRNKYSIFILGN